MEARTKIIAAVAVIMMCAAGLVGAGYAYTASTVNSGNDATSEYVLLGQDGTGKYTFSDDEYVFYDTVNTAQDVYNYRLSGGTENIVTGSTVAQIGETFSVTATGVNNQNETPLSGTFKTSGFEFAENWKLYLVLNNGSGDVVKTLTADDTWDNNTFTITYDTSAYTNMSVKAYYGYVGNQGVSTAPADKPLDGASITFTVTSTGSNPGLVLDIPVIVSLTVGETAKVTATLSAAPTGDVAWSVTSGNTYASVNAGEGTNKETVTITGVAAGEATITATVTISGVVYTATCTVTVVAAP